MHRLDLSSELEARLVRQELLARHTTFRIGGPADLFLRIDTRADLIQAVRAARAAGLDFFILGNGSNILVADAGIRGLVIENHADGYGTRMENGCLVLTTESGGTLPGLANRMARQGWSGLEWAIGVPSTIGAAVVGNAGAHGGSVADNLQCAEVLTRQGQIEWWPNAAFEFAYRSSRLKKNPSEWVVLQAEFDFKRDDPAACIARMNKYTEHRRRTQPTDPSVGSMFKNPPGDYSGRLIEAAGLKGTRVGAVEVSPVHANFFVNHGGATAQDIVALIELVRARVRDQFGVELELEIQLVGNW
ncbi:MAG: UDP-N-acetylmuramate dehydrogenase [Anaerolineae bacterium]